MNLLWHNNVFCILQIHHIRIRTYLRIPLAVPVCRALLGVAGAL